MTTVPSAEQVCAVVILNTQTSIQIKLHGQLSVVLIHCWYLLSFFYYCYFYDTFRSYKFIIG
jgi:hypothetical protein